MIDGNGNRRAFFATLAHGVLATVCDAAESVRAALPTTKVQEQSVRPWLRPPGALPEARFRSACTRCTDCIDACPYQAIRRLGPEWGDDAGTPAVVPVDSPCYLCPDMPCIAACEPGALLPVDRRDVAMGTAVIRRSSCYLTLHQPCDYCVERCPLKGEAIRFDAAGLPRINDERCTGCGVCAYLCPPGAIDIVPNGFSWKECAT